MGNSNRKLTRSALLTALSLAIASPTMAYAKEQILPNIKSQSQRLRELNSSLRGFGYNDTIQVKPVKKIENIDTARAEPDSLENKVKRGFNIGKVFGAIGSGFSNMVDYWGDKISKPKLVDKDKIDTHVSSVEEKDLGEGKASNITNFNSTIVNNTNLTEGYNPMTTVGSLLAVKFVYDRERSEDIIHIAVQETPLVESVRSQFSQEAQILASAMIKDDKHEIDRKMQTNIIEVPQKVSFSDISELYSDNEVIDEFKPSRLDSLWQAAIESKEVKEFAYTVNPEKPSEIMDDYQKSQDSLRALIKDWVASNLENPEDKIYLPQGITVKDITFKDITPITSTVDNPFDLDDLLENPKTPFLNKLKKNYKSSKESFVSNIPKKEDSYNIKTDSDTVFIYVKSSKENPKQDTISEAIRNHRIDEKLRVNNEILYGKNGDVKRVLGLNGITNDRKVKAGKYLYSIEEKVVDQSIAAGNGCVGSNNLETITEKSDSEVHNTTVPVTVNPSREEYTTISEPKHRRKKERGLQKLKFKGKDNEDSQFRKFNIDKAGYLFGDNNKFYEFVANSYKIHKDQYHYGKKSTLRHVRYDFRRETKKLEDAKGIKNPLAMNISDTTIYKILRTYMKSEIA